MRKVSVTYIYYSLYNGWLKTWFIEGSRHDKAGERLDQRDNNTNVMYRVSFSASKLSEYMFIRFRQTEKESIFLTKFELLGTLTE